MNFYVLCLFLFWCSMLVVAYTYIGYGILLYGFIKIKRLAARRTPPAKHAQAPEPFVLPLTVVIAAYNEADCIAEKLQNTLSLHYPQGMVRVFVITDGSTDATPQIAAGYPGVQVFHQPERQGKIAAVNRIMPLVNTPVVVYTDANTTLNPHALLNMVRHFANNKVGAVAGEKRIRVGSEASANEAGEGLYWKYESALKRWDSELYSVVGAAGELFAIRTNLYEPPPPDTIIEDFYKTLRIAQHGYRVIYEPNAFAMESASASVAEELKRKIRIAAGGLQAIFRLRALLNPFRYGLLSFQFTSHRVLRWTLAPLALPVLLLCNGYLVAAGGNRFWVVMLALQALFYLSALLGYLLETRKLRFKPFFVPFYFCMMNYAVYRGFWRIATGSQSVLWEKAKRA
ncbi:glycosyltransferase family 2 protein [Sphingobacteriales bacterium UPWRP_1]|nr:glycosyl transferase [Sphingobacteriales bacterium TSM_CSM]PSJ78517.1 glycosyltransferase family 2 protein [Sphingobacteriales bacterium UPWRP_1]